ncbi:hypothetical protein PHMEG_00014655 [Phytophthora megakarya]|uniref:Uncharacterized protein n=1 Tax=Phytophthora megakarya TaxID=4795 RepID=A0A225W4T7_9STRA|nr:hypothetical protein PHMEG_00014655 [Phytophthora megakarya]
MAARRYQSHANLHKVNRSQPNTSRDEKYAKKLGHLPVRPSTGRRKPYEISRDSLPDNWIEPKQQRAEQLLQDTWQVTRFKLLDERTHNDRNEFEAIANENQCKKRYVNNQSTTHYHLKDH